MKICDLHNDFLTDLNYNERKKYILKLIKDKKIKKVNCVVWTSKYKEVISKLKSFKLELNFNKKLFFSIEDLGFINNKNFSEVVNKIIEMNPFSCGLVWNKDNPLGGGTYGKKGLTVLGKKVINVLEENNILIDTAHMNKKTFYDFCRITTKPLFNSHCNFSSFKNHLRNLNIYQIKNIINSKGFICLSFVSAFIYEEICSCKIVAKQIAFFVSKFGSNNIGIGSDFYGTKKLPYDLKSYDNFKKLKKELKINGLSNKTINKIFFKNFEKFIKNI